MPTLICTKTDDRRADERYYVDMPPVLLQAEWVSEFIQIINIAHLGFLARTRLVYKTGDTARLTLPGFNDITCHIIWCRQGVVGGKFLAPIDINRLTRTQ